MANTPGYTFAVGDDTSADRHNTAIANAVIDLANNTSGELDGSKIADGTIDSSQFAPEWDGAGGTGINTAAGGFYFVNAGDSYNLPATPSNNDSVGFAQLSGDLSTTSASIEGNGKNIDYNNVGGAAADSTLTLNINFNGRINLTYNSGQDVWKLT